jgi:hypothetical protein
MIQPGSNCNRRLFDELNFEFISSMKLFKKSIPNLWYLLPFKLFCNFLTNDLTSDCN